MRGHESLREREVLEVLALAEGSEFDAGRIPARVDSLLELLASLGRPLARVSAAWDSSGAGVAVEVVLDEGPPVRLDALPFVGAAGETLALGPATPRAADSRLLSVEIDAVLDALANDGRPFAEVALPPVVTLETDGRVRAGLRVTSGPEVRFGRVVVAGNDVTRPHVIVRETGLAPGQPYSSERVASVRRRLEKLTFLDSVDEPVVAVDPETGEATVGVAVTEGTANRVSGVLGYSGGQGEDEVTGVVDILLGNIAGTGRAVSASWERIRAGQTEISFSYTEPWVFGAPIDIGVAGAQSVRDTFYTTTEADLLVTARMGERTRLTWSVGAERYVPGAEDESTTTSVRTAFSVAFDGADAPWNPTRGSRLSAAAEYSAKEFADSGRDESAGVFTAEAEQFLPIAARHVVALRARGQLLESTEDEVPYHELLVLGGARSLRGYREEQFRGDRTALASVEYRLLLGRRARAIAFVDAGHWSREGSNSNGGTELGYGIGLRGDTRLGTISLDYGLGEGDDLLDGKLHAGLIREF